MTMEKAFEAAVSAKVGSRLHEWNLSASCIAQ